jgi:alcohol dehydrogenase class IV
MSIIRKLGEHAENVKDIKDEMGMMQNSFTKVMTPLAENVRKLEDMLGKPSRLTKV